MPINALFAAGPERWVTWQAPLRTAFAAAGLDVDLSCGHRPEATDYIILAPSGPVRDFRPYTRTRVVMNIWAGVENIVGNPTLTQPLTRMVDPGLTRAMTEWVAGHVLRHHLGTDAHVLGQNGIWAPTLPRLAPERRVTVLGLGALGQAASAALRDLGFAVTGWSRRPCEMPGIRCLHGPEGLVQALTGAEIVVLLVPLTPQTENLMNAERLALMAPGAVLINPGRGALIDDDALLAALDAGQIGHATLDVFRVEPLPAAHPFWAHPKVTVTPHVAAETRPATAAPVIAENIRRDQAGEPLLHLVDPHAGY